ncbi:SCO4225 family membrane protein [Streptomyces sp. NPDC003832]
MKRSARPRRAIRTLLAPATDNWLSRAYLTVVAAALGFFVYAVHFSQDPGFAGIYPIITTAPLSFLALTLAMPLQGIEWLSTLVFSLATIGSGLVNATFLGLLARRLRTGAARPAAGH